MSIVICIIEKDQNFYLASDLRAIREGKTSDDFQKVFELKSEVYFGMTGIAESGFPILEKLRKENFKTKNEVIHLANKFFQPDPLNLSIMLCGKNEKGGYFCWQKNNTGKIAEIDVRPSNIGFAICSNENVNKFNNHLTLLLGTGESVETAIADTIRFASNTDQTISPAYNIIKHPSH